MSLENPDFELSTLVAARICHDFVNPIGAISNGLDLMRELGTADTSAEMAMLLQSAERLSKLASLLRLAFGRASHDAEPVTREKLRQITAPLIERPRVVLSWENLDGAPVPSPLARATALAIMCARASLGMQGSMKIDLPDKGLGQVSVSVEGPKAGLSDQAAVWLSEQQDSLALPESRQIEFALLRPACSAAGHRLDVRATVGHVEFAIPPLV